MQNVIILNAIMQNVIILNVVAPKAPNGAFVAMEEVVKMPV
jgi:hypothetical protein